MIGVFDHRRRAPGRGIVRVAGWDFGSLLCDGVLSLLYRFRVEGRHNVPRTGPVIFVANHQSLLDPMIHGIAVTDRAPRPMAREGLFRNPALGAGLRAISCIMVREEGGNMETMRLALEELRMGRTVMLYPEGTRSADGEVHEFQRGVQLLVRRSGAPVVPMGIDGAFAIWPRTQRLPYFSGRIWAAIGEPIFQTEWERDFAHGAEGLEALRRRVECLVLQCRSRLARFNRSGDTASPDEAWLS